MPTIEQVLNYYPQFIMLNDEQKQKLISIYLKHPEALKEDLSQIDKSFAILPEDKKNYVINVIRNNTIKSRDYAIMHGEQIGNFDKENIITPEEKLQADLWKKEHQEQVDIEKAKAEEPEYEVKSKGLKTSELLPEFIKELKGIYHGMQDVGTKILATGEYLLGNKETAKAVLEEQAKDIAQRDENERLLNHIGEFIANTAILMIPTVSGAGVGRLLKEIATFLTTDAGFQTLKEGVSLMEHDEKALKDLYHTAKLDILLPVFFTGISKAVDFLVSKYGKSIEKPAEEIKQSIEEVQKEEIPTDEKINKIKEIINKTEKIAKTQKDLENVEKIIQSQFKQGEIIENVRNFVEENKNKIIAKSKQKVAEETLEDFYKIADRTHVSEDIDEFVPFSMQGNKQQLLKQKTYRNLYQKGLEDADNIVDVFTGTGLNHFVIDLFPNNIKRIVKNEGNPLRYKWHKGILENPVKIVNKLKEYAEEAKKILKENNDIDIIKSKVKETVLKDGETPAVYWFAQLTNFKNMPINSLNEWKVAAEKIKKAGKYEIYIRNIKTILSKKFEKLINKLKQIHSKREIKLYNYDGWRNFKDIKPKDGKNFIIFDPDYIDKGTKKITHYVTKEGYISPHNIDEFKDAFEKYILPYLTENDKIILTNTWDNKLAKYLYDKGFNIYKTYRGGGKYAEAELIATNFDMAGRVSDRFISNAIGRQRGSKAIESNVRQREETDVAGFSERGIQQTSRLVEKISDSRRGIEENNKAIKESGQEISKNEILTNQDINLHAGINPIEATNELIKASVNILKNRFEIVDKILTSLDNLVLKLYEPFYDVTAKQREKIKDIIYGTLKPALAKVDISAQTSAEKIKKILMQFDKAEKKTMEIAMIKYFENPVFRVELQKELPELANELESIRKLNENIREVLYKSGYLTKSQYEKWKGKYLFRPYKQTKENIAIKGQQLKQPEILKGRKYESILDELGIEEAEKIGYVADPVLATKMTIAKSLMIIALDKFFKQLIKEPEVVAPEVRPFLIKIYDIAPSLKAVTDELPEIASPYWVWEKLIKSKWLLQQKLDGKITQQELKNIINITKENLKNIAKAKKLISKDYVDIGDIQKTRYGVLSGLPVKKSVAEYLGIMNPLVIDPDPSIFNKALSAALAFFKMMKVPLNFQALPRNWISNFFQWTMNKGNPLSYFKYYEKAIMHLIKKDDFFNKIKEAGVFNTNYASEEIQRVIYELRTDVSSRRKLWHKLFEMFSKASIPYGMIDDLAKMARIEYDLNKGMNFLDAIKDAQFTHYDYSLVPKWVEQARSSKISEGMWWKIFNTPFLSYAVKTTALMHKMAKESPAELLLWLSALPVLTYEINQYYHKKYPKLAKLVDMLTPEYMKRSTMIRFIDPDKKTVYFFPIDYIFPFAQLVKYLDKEFIGILHGIADFFGLGESPLGNFFGGLIGVDPYTGKRIWWKYYDTEEEKAGKTLGFWYKTFLEPATLTHIREVFTSQHPIETKLIGMNVYKYNLKQLYYIKKAELKELQSEFIKNLYYINRKEFDQEATNKKIKEYLERRKEILGGK